ncbi:MAG: hypothetical protein ACJAWP_000866 [Porticoccus sp.]|jgi:hypothetical protein|uniref:DUF748 domain-containing protein n=1 Tax=Porticoccus sp. TaxID=2024853 RepID=UPI0039E6092B|tara:strand:+ start:65691 stop:68507 length:2817 start_codon:yes stop_codon:yes gene_type:complete
MKKLLICLRWSLIGVALLVVVVLSLLPFMIRWQGAVWLEKQGLDADIGYVEIRPMLGTVQVNNVHIQSPGGERLILDQLLFDIAWNPLLENSLHIEEVSIEGLTLDLAMTPSGLRVGGIPLPTDEAAPDEAGQPLFERLALDQFQLRDLTFCYLLMNEHGKQRANQCAGLNALRFNDLAMALGETPSLSLPGVSLRGLRWFDRLDPLQLATVESLAVTGLSSPDMTRWQLEKVNLQSLALLPGDTPAVQLNELALTGFNLAEDVELNTVSLDALAVGLARDQTNGLAFAPALLERVGQLSPETASQGAVDANGEAEDRQIRLKQFALRQLDIGTERPLLSAGKLRFSDMRLAGTAVAVDTLTLGHLNLLSGAEEALALDSLDMRGLDVNRDVAIAGLTLGDLQVRLETDSQGALVFAPTLINQLASTPEKNDGVAEGIEPPAEEPVAMGFEMGDLQLGSLAVFADRELLSLDALGLQQLKLAGDQIELARLEVSTVDFLAPAPGAAEVSHYVKIPRLSLDELAKKSGTFSLGKLQIGDPEIFVHRDADGGLSMLSELAILLGQDGEMVAGESEDSAQQPTTENAPPLKLQLASLTIGEQGQLRILDESVSPSLDQRFTGVNLNLKHLDSTRTDTPAEVNLNMALNQFGALSLAGQVAPFGDALSSDLEGEIKGIDVRDISGYAKKFIGYHLDQGLVDVDTSVDILEDTIDSVVTVRLHKLQVSPVSKADLEAGAAELGVPLEFALSLLRDKNGMIELKLPISGNINSPTFSIRHIVNKVMFKVIKETVINYYLPFGLVVKTLVGDSLAGMGFEPVVFEPGTAALDDTGEANLNRLSDMLQKRQQLQLVFCAPATLQDWAAQFSPDELANLQSSVENPQLPDITVEQSAELAALANQRTVVAKQYLIDHGVTPGQIILCTGKFDQRSTLRAEMSITIGQ